MMESVLIHGDCLEHLPGIPDGAADLVLTDPPYGISANVVIRRKSNPGKFSGKDINYNFGEWDKFASEKDFWRFTMKWAGECVRILAPGGVFCSYFDRARINFLATWLARRHGFRGLHYLADVKTNPVPQIRKVKWANGWEEMLLLIKPGGPKVRQYQWEEGHHPDYWIRPIVGGEFRHDHPCQKPLEVMMDVVRWWSPPGGMVLDPFAGTGTVPAASQMLGRRYIGMEVDRKYFDVMKGRVSTLDFGMSLAGDGARSERTLLDLDKEAKMRQD